MVHGAWPPPRFPNGTTMPPDVAGAAAAGVRAGAMFCVLGAAILDDMGKAGLEAIGAAMFGIMGIVMLGAIGAAMLGIMDAAVLGTGVLGTGAVIGAIYAELTRVVGAAMLGPPTGNAEGMGPATTAEAVINTMPAMLSNRFMQFPLQGDED